MPIDDLVAIGLVPLPSNSRLWSMAASAYALSNEPKDAFDLITYAEEMAPSSVVCAALITMVRPIPLSMLACVYPLFFQFLAPSRESDGMVQNGGATVQGR